MTALRFLVGALLVFTGSIASGYLLVRTLRLPLRGAERRFFEFLLGAMVLSNYVFLLCATSLIYTPVMAGGAIALICAAVFLARRPGPVECRETLSEGDPASPELTLFWKLLFWIPYIVFGVLYLCNAMLPETSADAMVYHLGLVSRYFDHHGFYPVDSLYGGFSAAIEMLFLIAYPIGGFSAAAVTHLMFLLAMPWGMLAFARRFGRPEAGVIGSVLFFVAPVVGMDGSSAYNDAGAAAAVFGCFYLLCVWRVCIWQERCASHGLLIAAGLLGGFAFACKYTGGAMAVFAVPFVAFTLLVERKLNWKQAIGPVTIVGAAAFLVMLPWLTKNVVYYGDPFFPFFTNLFPTSHFYPMIEADYHRGLSHMNGVGLGRIPRQVLVEGNLTGVIGPVFALAPVALFSLKRRFGRIVLLGFIVAAATYFGNIGTRFLIPSLPFLSLAIGESVLMIPSGAAPVAAVLLLAHATLSWPSLIPKWSARDYWHLPRPNWKAALRIVPEAEYLRANYDPYDLSLALDRLVPSGEKILSPDFDHIAYHHRELVGSWESSTAKRAYEVFAAPSIDYGDRLWRRVLTFVPAAASGIRLTVRKSPGSELAVDLRISEIRFFHGIEEIPRAPEWRLSSSANPWEVPLAFDGDLLSWWTTGRHVNIGEWLRVDLNGPETIDRIVIDQPVDSRWFDFQTAFRIGEKWTDVQAQISASEFRPNHNMRMAAAAELERMGIRWILIRKTSRGAEDLRARAPSWGITETADIGPFTLWHLD